MRPCAWVLSCACALSCVCVLSRVHKFLRAPVFLRFQQARRSAALFDRAPCPGLPADPDAARKAIARDGAAGREHGTGGCGAVQAAAWVATAA